MKDGENDEILFYLRTNVLNNLISHKNRLIKNLSSEDSFNHHPVSSLLDQTLQDQEKKLLKQGKTILRKFSKISESKELKIDLNNLKNILTVPFFLQNSKILSEITLSIEEVYQSILKNKTWKDLWTLTSTGQELRLSKLSKDIPDDIDKIYLSMDAFSEFNKKFAAFINQHIENPKIKERMSDIGQNFSTDIVREFTETFFPFAENSERLVIERAEKLEEKCKDMFSINVKMVISYLSSKKSVKTFQL